MVKAYQLLAESPGMHTYSWQYTSRYPSIREHRQTVAVSSFHALYTLLPCINLFLCHKIRNLQQRLQKLILENLFLLEPSVMYFHC